MASTMNTNTRTPEEMEALRQKHKEGLAVVEAARAGRLHITKVRQGVKAATLYNWVVEGKAVVAPWNRDEVKGREGDEHEWMKSLAEKISPGQFIAYYHGKVGKDGKITPTKECPLVIYEGGHRTRWTKKVFGGEATYGGMTYSELCDLAPETAKAIEGAVIEMTIAASQNLPGLEEFARTEYEKVNTNGEVLKAGEVIRAATDATRAELEATLQGVLRRDLKPKKRDAHLEEIRALVHGAAGLVDQMDKTKKSLTNVSSLTAAQEQRAQTILNEFGLVEEEICDLPELSGKADQKRLQSRKIDLAVDGTLMWALQDATGEAEREMVREDWVEYHRRFFGDKTVWKAKMTELKAPTNKRRSYDRESPFPVRWRRIQAALRPAALVEEAEDIDAGEVM